jgi:hypothetical protein
MTLTNDFSLALRDRLDIEAGTGFPGISPVLPDLPALSDVLTRLAPLPAGGIFFGMAGDGLPLLLNVFDPSPGAIVILGDSGAGKTDFLRLTARGTMSSHPSPIVDFVAITPNRQEWVGLDSQPNCLGVWESYDERLADLLFDLTQRAQKAIRKRPILLLIDDLSQLGHLDREVVEMLYWLLQNGPAGRIWPIVTLNAAYARELPNWMMVFPTRILGYVREPSLGRELAHHPGVNLNTLLPGGQFCMRENGSWLRFWLPSIS